ncbi:MAG: sulfite exporter TauE/SafE family protein [Spirochaetaceae bacterium]|nr:sulfite exporter TauE/SafE family protein [Spirochaetaceae bacterium]
MENLIISFPISLIIFVSSLVQGATGFGFGVIAIPLLTTFCLSPEIALPLSATAAVTQSLYGVVRFRKIINIKEILILSLYCNAGMVMGVLTLHEITRFNQGLFGIIIGIILLVIVSVKTFLKIEPRDIVPWYWGAAALSMGGYICGLAGVGGPVIVLWVLAHKWDNDRIRVTLWSVFLLMTILQIVLYCFVFGNAAFRGFLSGLLIIPVVLIGSFTGIQIGNKLNGKMLNIVISVIIVLISVYSIAKPLL